MFRVFQMVVLLRVKAVYVIVLQSIKLFFKKSMIRC